MGTGTRHYFRRSEEDSNTYVDEDGLGFTVTANLATITIKDKDGNISCFNQTFRGGSCPTYKIPTATPCSLIYRCPSGEQGIVSDRRRGGPDDGAVPRLRRGRGIRTGELYREPGWGVHLLRIRGWIGTDGIN